MGLSQGRIMQTSGNVERPNIDGVLVLKNKHDMLTKTSSPKEQ